MKRIFLWSALLLLSLALPKNSFAQEIDFDQIPLEAFKPEVKSAADSVLLAIDQDAEKAGKEAFAEFLRKYRKDGDQMYRAAQYFIDNDKYYCAKFCFDQALGAYPKHRKLLEMKATLGEKVGDLGAAAGAYEEILTYVDSTDLNAIRMTAYNYRIANVATSVEYFNKILKQNPNDAMANMWMGWHSYNDAVAERAAGRKKRSEEYYADAAKYYGVYYENTPADSLEIYHCERYVNSLPLKTSKDCSKMIKLCKILGKQAPQSKIFKHYKLAATIGDPAIKEMLESYETLSERQQMYRMMYTDGDDAILYVTNKEFPDSLYNFEDYYFVSQHKGYKGEIDEAVSYMEKAIALDTTNINAYDAMYLLLRENNKFKESLPYFLTSLELKEKNNIAHALDTVALAKLYGLLLQKETDSLQSAVWYEKADSLWGYIDNWILKKDPQSPQVRASLALNYKSDPEDKVGAGPMAGVAARHFQECANRIKKLDDQGKAEYRNAHLTALNYVAIYHYRNKNLQKALEVYTELNDLQPGEYKDYIKLIKYEMKSSPSEQIKEQPQEQTEEQPQE